MLSHHGLLCLHFLEDLGFKKATFLCGEGESHFELGLHVVNCLLGFCQRIFTICDNLLQASEVFFERYQLLGVVCPEPIYFDLLLLLVRFELLA